MATLKVDVSSISVDGVGNVTAKEINTGTIYKGKAIPISDNSGNINTGTAGGHNVSVQGGDYQKIIEKDKIELIAGDVGKVYLQKIASLEAEIVRLEAIVKSKDETIAAKDETIAILKNK